MEFAPHVSLLGMEPRWHCWRVGWVMGSSRSTVLLGGLVSMLVSFFYCVVMLCFSYYVVCLVEV